jgi:DNA-binding beta-propeller fold protein YncE
MHRFGIAAARDGDVKAWMRRLWLLVVAACGNSLPPPGTCDVATNGETVDVTPVALSGGRASYDDLRYSPELRKVVAAPHGTGVISLIDPDSLAVQTLTAPGGVYSADASTTTVYAADRGADRIIAIDVASGAMVATQAMPGTPDYVRFSPMTNEVWVSLPGTNRLEILDAASLAVIGSVTLPGPPEGLTFDGERAYSHALGRVIASDVARRLVVGEWSTGCGYSHGFPQVDDQYQLAFGGCFSNGGVGVVTMSGAQRAGFEAGGGEAILAYDQRRHHLYVRGDPGGTLDILATCSSGELGVLARVAISNDGHGASADDRGHVWVADATTGGVLRVTDPFAATK